MRRFAVSSTPPEARHDLAAHGQCLYGVSVGAIGKQTGELLDGYRWSQAHFPRCAMLLGDSLYRFTLQIQQGCDGAAAAAIAQQRGQALADEILALLPEPPSMLRCSEVLVQPGYAARHQAIAGLYREHAAFRASVEADALVFVRRQAAKQRLAVAEARALELAVIYLLEEIAIYDCLAGQGWLVDVYLGAELPTLAKIIAGAIAGVPGPLSQRVNISLRAK